MTAMKLTKAQLKEMVQKELRSQMNEASDRDKRVMRLDRFRQEVNLTTLELLEDVIEMLDDQMWRQVVVGLKNKYGYKV